MEKICHDSFIPLRLDTFWKFIGERQAIWHRRTVDKLPPPWTADQVLRRFRFTNVYRELDPGTMYAINKILELRESKVDKIFNIMIYRLIGRSETHEALGFQRLTDFNSKEIEKILEALKESGKPPFTGAYLVSGYTMMGSHNKIINVVKLFSWWRDNFQSFYKRLSESRSPSQACMALKSNKGIGRFLSYQAFVDLCYPLKIYSGKAVLPFNNDEWAEAGPGARRGIKMLTAPSTRASDLDIMVWLRDNQNTEFERLGIKFEFLFNNDKPIKLSLANIQNCLCEFHKYIKILNGTGRSRRLFTLKNSGSIQ
ncbi:MAG: putative DNA base hypermodification protein [Candidatus Parvarchaeota archaeon]|nr:putative DNA base hypermodification protein [Candidatus Parvarchaeota archaeon]